VIFEGGLPKDVPGSADLEKRRGEFKTLLAKVSLSSDRAGVSWAVIGRGHVWVGSLDSQLMSAAVARESLFNQPGLMCIRRAVDGGRYYFIANRGTNGFDGWLPLACAAKSVVAMDALSGATGVATSRSNTNSTEVYLHLAAGESVILRTFDNEKVSGAAWPLWFASPGSEIKGEWKVDFTSGGPVLPASFTMKTPGSWTQSGDTNAQSFAGAARYSVTFDLAAAAQFVSWSLDLGKVVQSARVKLNGKDYGTLITPPFRVVVDNLKPAGNVLEVEVTSTSANRIRDLDRRGVKWQYFNDINFVNMDYKKFNAADWPLTDAGLLGPVTLTAAIELKP
jgi:hypothetical protein